MQCCTLQGHPFPPDPAHAPCGSSGRNVEAPGISSLYSSTGRLRVLEPATAVHLKSCPKILVRMLKPGTLLVAWLLIRNRQTSRLFFLVHATFFGSFHVFFFFSGADHHPVHRLSRPDLFLLLRLFGGEGRRGRGGQDRLLQLRRCSVVGRGKAAEAETETHCTQEASPCRLLEFFARIPDVVIL